MMTLVHIDSLPQHPSITTLCRSTTVTKVSTLTRDKLALSELPLKWHSGIFESTTFVMFRIVLFYSHKVPFKCCCFTLTSQPVCCVTCIISMYGNVCMYIFLIFGSYFPDIKQYFCCWQPVTDITVILVTAAVSSHKKKGALWRIIIPRTSCNALYTFSHYLRCERNVQLSYKVTVSTHELHN